MSTRAGVKIKNAGKEHYYTRHWDGYPEGIASDLRDVDLNDVLDIFENLHLDGQMRESGIDYYYEIDMDTLEIKAYEADWKTDEPKKLLFSGKMSEFRKNEESA